METEETTINHFKSRNGVNKPLQEEIRSDLEARVGIRR